LMRSNTMKRATESRCEKGIRLRRALLQPRRLPSRQMGSLSRVDRRDGVFNRESTRLLIPGDAFGGFEIQELALNSEKPVKETAQAASILVVDDTPANL